MPRSSLLRLSIAASAAVIALLAGFAAPDAATASTCYCTLPYTLSITGTGGSCGAASSNFDSQANLWSGVFCNSLTRPTTVCDGPHVTSQTACYWDFNLQTWRIDGFVDGHCLYCPGPKFPPAP